MAGTESLRAGFVRLLLLPARQHDRLARSSASPATSRPPPPPGPFLEPLPIPEERTGSDITLHVREADVPVLPGAPTPMYTYDGTFPGPTIRRPAGEPTRVTFVNELPATAGEATVHRHGGHNASVDDGQPARELIPSGASRTYTYDLMEGGEPERAAFEWYHDHRLDRTGENLWRGLAGMFIVEDDFEAALPLPRGEFDVPIMLAERTFDEDNELTDPFVGRTPPGDEVVGDRLLANGRHQPFFEVAARRYRVRLLNASNFSLYNLRLSNGAPLTQIGTESGLLPAPVVRDSVLIGPAERAEVVIDFAGHARRGGRARERARAPTAAARSASASDATSAAVLQFRVTRDAVDDSSVPEQLRPLPELAASPVAHPRSDLGRRARLRPGAQRHGVDVERSGLPRAHGRRPARARHDRDVAADEPDERLARHPHPRHRLRHAVAQRPAATAVGGRAQGDLPPRPRRHACSSPAASPTTSAPSSCTATCSSTRTTG